MYTLRANFSKITSVSIPFNNQKVCGVMSSVYNIYRRLHLYVTNQGSLSRYKISINVPNTG